MRPWPYPSLSVALALLAGTLAAVSPFGVPAMLVPNGAGIAIAAFVVGMIHTLVLGLPAYLGLARRVAPTFWIAGSVGFLIGALPVSLLSLLSVPLEASVDGVVTASNGSLTLAGLVQLAGTAGAAGFMGAFGGLSFLLALKLTTRLPDGDGRRALRPLRTLGLALANAAMLTVAPVVAAATYDRSCHNPLTHGVTSMSPKIYASLEANPQDWDRVSEILETVAADHNLDFRPNQESGSAIYRVFDVSACSPNGVIINVLQHRADPEAFPSTTGLPREAMDMSIGVYQPNGGEDWREPAQDLFDRLEADFGDRLTYTGERGEPVSRNEAERP